MTRKTSFCILHSAFCIRLLALCIVHCALCISSAFATTITAVADGAMAGDLKTVTATVSGGTVDALYLVYHAVGSSFVGEGVNTNAMTGSGDTFTGCLPSLPGGTVLSWFVTDGTVSSQTYTTTLAATPDYNRYHDGKLKTSTTADFMDANYGWQEMVALSNYVAATPNGSQWVANGVGIGISARNMGAIDTSIGMAYPCMFFHNLPLSADPYIRSPKLVGGVGTIDFRTILIGNTVKTSALTLQKAYTENDPMEADWIDVATYTYGTLNGGVFPRICHEVLNDSAITYLRVVRTGYNIYNPDVISSGRLAVDNICITKPPANVGIIEKLKNPGYPAADQDILMRCAVTNCVEETPAINRRVSVKYKYVARESEDPNSSLSPWLSADMAYRGKDGDGLDWYEGTIPTQKVGYVWYYYQVDYDGYHYGVDPHTGVSESISPAYWNDGRDTHTRPTAGARFQVRPYRSRYSRIALTAQTEALSVGEMTLVGDELWQTIVPVSGATVVSNYFTGYGFYADDAAAYEQEPVLWGENNPDALSDPTLAGFLESTHDTVVTNRLVALNEKDYRGFYYYRFSSNDYDEEAQHSGEGGDRRYDYIVKKAVYQDFDDWTASPDYYESSLGGLPTLTYTENFDGNAASAQGGAICVTNAWREDFYAPGELKGEAFSDEELTDDFSPNAIMSEQGFIRQGSRIIADRKTTSANTNRANRTLALQLNGQIENTKGSLPYGLEKVTFRARASIDDRNFALYKNGTDWGLPLFIAATWELQTPAPSKPYFSYVFLYQPPMWEGASWYELRIVQADSANVNNDTINIELWHHSAEGVENRVASKNNITGYKLETSRRVNLKIEKDGNDLRVRIKFSANANSVDPTSSPTADLKHTGALRNVTPTGTIGFGVFDAVPNITFVTASSTSYSGTDLINSLSSTYANWHPGGKRLDGSNLNRWTITTGSITREVPAQTIGLYAANCVGGESRAEIDELPEEATETVTVNSLQMTDFSVDFKAWNKKFVQLRYEKGDGGVVIDDLVYYPWRAKTRYNENDAETADRVSYLDWTTPEQQENWLERALGASGDDSMLNHWAVMEGWTVHNSEANKIGANFERSRANTNLVQGVVSPFLANGIGSISFSYAASGGNVVYGVERTDGSEDNMDVYQLRNWTPVAVFTNAAGTSGERYVKIGKYFRGRVRVRIYGRDDVAALLHPDNQDCGYEADWGYTDDTAKLLVDNLRVKDYPKDENDNAWNAYNLRITDNAAYADQGLIYNNSGKSCFFNNDATNGVYGVEEFSEDDPYLESPPLKGVGVGEIAFQYRIVPGTAQAGTDGTIVIKVAPDRDTPLAQWKTITNLVVSADGTAFVKFDNEKIFEEKNFVVRFYNSRDPGTPRFVIDNVLVTAPARASFEFEYVKLLPAQPLSGTNTVVEAKIMREIMNPKNIRIFCSWHKYDTNNVEDLWGVDHWFDARTSPYAELTRIGETKVFRSADNGGIPAFAVDDIVEFVVWGVHRDININAGDPPIKQGEETFEAPEWYRTFNEADDEIVAVDLNEDKKEEGWSPYFWVYSCAPGTFFVNEINNWYSSNPQGDKNPPEYIEFVAPAWTEIGGWKFKIVKNGSGRAFDYTVPAGTRVGQPAGNGWGFYVWGDSWMSASNIVSQLDAEFPDSASPGKSNLYYYGGILVFRSNGMIEQAIQYGEPSYVTGDYWTPAGRKQWGDQSSLSLISKMGDDDEPVAGATVDDFRWDRAARTPTEANGFGQIFAEIGGDTPVVMALYYPDGTEITDDGVLAWIETYNAGRSTEDIQTDINGLSMDEFNKDFLLNLDFTKTCVGTLSITSIAVEDGYVYLNVQLVRTEDGTPVGTRAINGRLKLLGRASLTSGAFAPLQLNPFDATFSTGDTVGLEYELPAQNPPAFFRAVIQPPETND